MKKLIVNPFFMVMILCFVASSCNKEDTLPEELISVTETQDVAPTKKLGNPCLVVYHDLFLAQLKDHRKVDPRSYFPEQPYDEFLGRMQGERMVMKQMGYDAYIDDLNQTGALSDASRDLMLHVYYSVEGEGPLDVPQLIQNLEQNYDPKFLPEQDYAYCMLYQIALSIYQDFYGDNPGGVTFRGECDFKEFVQHVFKSAGVGFAIGGFVGNVIKEDGELVVVKLFGLTIEIGFGIIGGAIGGLVGLFNFKNKCDECNEADGISIQSDDDCDLTRTLYVFGTGDDSAAWEWRLNQGGTTETITTADPFLSVTQVNSAEPVGVSVAAVCEDGLTDFTTTELIDLSSAATSPLGQVGEVTFTYECPFENAWGEYVNRCFHIDADVAIAFVAGNDASGSITYTYDLTFPGNNPASGDILPLSDKSVRISWDTPGNARLTVTATNICSGLTNSESILMNVTDN